MAIVFFYGEKPWDRAKSLFNLVDIHRVEDTTVFKTSLGKLIDLMKIRKDKQKLKHYIERHEAFFAKTSSEIFDLITALVDSKWLSEQKERYYCGEKGGYDMCTGMKEWLADVMNEGMERGMECGMDTACQIIADARQGQPAAAIAAKYNVDTNKVMMIIHAMTD